MGIANPVTKVDLRGAGNSANSVGIGQTTQTAADAGAGALRYSPFNGGRIQFSEGTVWSNLQADPRKVSVVAEITSYIGATGVAFETVSDITSYREKSEADNALDATTGIFKAPRPGFYLISIKCNTSFAAGSGTGTLKLESNCTNSFSLKAGDKIIVGLYMALGGGNKTLIADGNYNNLAIVQQ